MCGLWVEIALDRMDVCAYIDGMTKHTHPANFGRKIDGCPRCGELLAGAKPIQWKETRQAMAEAQAIADIKAHNCVTSRCGPVCTFGDW